MEATLAKQQNISTSPVNIYYSTVTIYNIYYSTEITKSLGIGYSDAKKLPIIVLTDTIVTEQVSTLLESHKIKQTELWRRNCGRAVTKVYHEFIYKSTGFAAYFGYIYTD